MKSLVYAVCLVLASPFIAIARVASRCGNETVFVALGCLLSLIPGKFGSYLRVAYYRGTLAHMAPDVRVGFGSFFSKRQAWVASGVHIGAYCIIGRARLGRHVIIASRVSVTSGRHQHGDASGGLRLADDEFSAVSIGDHTWVGEGAIVLSDVGRESLIGAGAVVVKPIGDGVLAVGNPAIERQRVRTDVAVGS